MPQSFLHSSHLPMRSSNLLAELCGISSDANEFDLMLNYLVFFLSFLKNNSRVLGMILTCNWVEGTIDNIFFYKLNVDWRPLLLV